MRHLTRARLILAALRYRLKHEGGTMPVDDYRKTQMLIDEYQERLNNHTQSGKRP